MLAFSPPGISTVIVPHSVASISGRCSNPDAAIDRYLIFESDSGVTQIDESAFSGCFGLKSICIPPLTEILAKSCSIYCYSLSTLNFASGATLSRIDEFAFGSCSRLNSICIPASVEPLGNFVSLSALPFQHSHFNPMLNLRILENLRFLHV
jgi:hypothetical protein